MSGSGVNAMQIQIQGLFKETVFQLEQEVKVQMAFLDEYIPKAMKALSEKSGIACSPTQDRARRARVQQETASLPQQTPGKTFFTPYGATGTVSRMDEKAKQIALPDATPVGGRRKRGNVKDTVSSDDRASISSAVKGSNKRAPLASVGNKVAPKDEDQRSIGGSVRRSLRITGKEPDVPVERICTPPKLRIRKSIAPQQQVKTDARDKTTVRRSMRLAEKEPEMVLSIDLDATLKTPPRVRERRGRKAKIEEEEEEEDKKDEQEQSDVEEAVVDKKTKPKEPAFAIPAAIVAVKPVKTRSAAPTPAKKGSKKREKEGQSDTGEEDSGPEEIVAKPVDAPVRRSRRLTQLNVVPEKEEVAEVPKPKKRSRIQKNNNNNVEVVPVETKKQQSGKRVAQMISKFEQPEPVAKKEEEQKEPEEQHLVLSLSREEGASLALKLDAIASGALEAVASSSHGSRKRKPVSDRAKAWSNRRGVTHQSFKDLLVANGIVRPEASEATIDRVIEAIPEAVGELGDEAVNASVSLNKTQTNLNKTAFVMAEDESESGVSDSEDESAAFMSNVVTDENGAIKSLSTIQDKIAEIKKKFGATSATPSSPALNKAAAAIAPSVDVASVPIVAPSADASLHLGAPDDFAKGCENVLLGNSLHVVKMDEDDSMADFQQSQQDIAPGLFTQEISTPDRIALKQMREVEAAKEKSMSSISSTFMDGSFMGSGDGEMYTTIDAERAMNAVQFLEQIQLGNTSILHNITLSAPPEDDNDAESLSSHSDKLSPLVEEEEEEEEKASQVQPQIESIPLEQAEVQNPRKRSAEEEYAPPVVRNLAAAIQAVQNSEPVPVAKVAKTSIAVKPVATTAPVKDKLEQAKLRREQLEEEERKRREDALKKASEREQRAKALKEGKTAKPTAAPVTAPAPEKPANNLKALILEKGKRNAEKLVKTKVEEMRKKGTAPSGTATVQPTAPAATAPVATAPVAASAPTSVAAADKKGGLFNPFKMLKKPSTATVSAPAAQQAVAVAPAPVAPETPKAFFSHHGPAKETGSPLSASKGKSPLQPRPSPLKKALLQYQHQQQHAASPPVSDASTTQYSISPCKESGVDGDVVVEKQKVLKREAKWAKRDMLHQALVQQQSVDADDVFGAQVGLTCNLTDVFENYRPRKKYQARSSSAQWSDAGAAGMNKF